MDGSSRYPIPFVADLPSPMTENWVLTASVFGRGSPTERSSRLIIQLKKRDIMFSHEEIALNLDINFRTRSVIINSMQNGQWGMPEVTPDFPFHPAAAFDIIILNKVGVFQVTYGSHGHKGTYKFHHRMPVSQITQFAIDGDFLIQNITIDQNIIRHDGTIKSSQQTLGYPSLNTQGAASSLQRPIGFVSPGELPPFVPQSLYPQSQPLHSQVQPQSLYPQAQQSYSQTPYNQAQSLYTPSQTPFNQALSPYAPNPYYAHAQVPPHPGSVLQTGTYASHQNQGGSAGSSFDIGHLKAAVSSVKNKKAAKRALKYGAPLAAGALVGGLLLKKGKWKHHGGGSSSSSSSSSDSD